MGVAALGAAFTHASASAGPIHPLIAQCGGLLALASERDGAVRVWFEVSGRVAG